MKLGNGKVEKSQLHASAEHKMAYSFCSLLADNFNPSPSSFCIRHTGEIFKHLKNPMQYKVQWNPDFRNPHFFEPISQTKSFNHFLWRTSLKTTYLRDGCFFLLYYSLLKVLPRFLQLSDFSNQFAFLFEAINR